MIDTVMKQDQHHVADLKKEEAPFAQKDEHVPPKDTLLSKFTQLWFACYFERKLTRQRVCDADLSLIISDLVAYFCTDVDRVDFRRATPLLTGLHNLFVKRLGLLMRDTETILKEMSDPIIKLEVA